MPFRSKKQQAYLYARHPEVAEKFAEDTPKSVYANLPTKVSDKNHLKEYSKKHRRPKK
jgi:hypothetical protein